jgi:hypothetical protein
MKNPYQPGSPTNEKYGIFQQDQSPEGLEANSSAQSYLYSIKGWLKFISVLGFISFGVIVLYMLIVTFVMSALSGGEFGFGIMFLLPTLVMTIMVFMLALRLSKYSSSIGRMQISRSPTDLENAMIEQMKFWRLTGILVLVLLVFILLGIVFS